MHFAILDDGEGYARGEAPAVKQHVRDALARLALGLDVIPRIEVHRRAIGPLETGLILDLRTGVLRVWQAVQIRVEQRGADRCLSRRERVCNGKNRETDRAVLSEAAERSEHGEGCHLSSLDEIARSALAHELDHHTVLHHEAHALGDTDVLERITRNGNDVGEHALDELAAVGGAAQLGGADRGGL